VSEWTNDELAKIGASDELQLGSLQQDGTLRKPVTIWVVRHGDHLYVRSVRGRTSAWFRGVRDRHQGHIRAGDVEKDVTFVEVEDVDDEVDEAYRAKYGRYPAEYVDPIVAAAARAATLELIPAPAGAD
jgi:hypothetical protein